MVKECMETLLKLPQSYTFRNVFEIMCGYGDRVAAELTEKDGTLTTVTYEEYRALARGVGQALEKEIGAKNKCVGIKLENSPMWPAMLWGILMSGNVPLLLDVRAEQNITQHLLAESGAIGIITEEQEKYPEVKVLRPAELLEKKAKNSYEPKWADMICLCTSGTTGTSKIYAYDGFAMSKQIENAKYFLGENEDIMYDAADGPLKNLAFLPMHHIFGFVAVYLWFSFFGKTIVYLSDKSPKGIMEACRKHQVTHIFNVPLFWNNVAQGIMRKVRQGGERRQKQFETLSKISHAMQKNMKKSGRKILGASALKSIQQELIGSGVRFLINGGGHIVPETMRIINDIGYPLYNGFGMTEAGITSVELSRDIDVRLKASVGKPFESVEYKVLPTGADESVGELVIRGDSLFSGRMIGGKFIPREEEWYQTGDIARLDADGRLWIEGRVKEVIIGASGENVYPDEVEGYFSELPGVEQMVVLGLDAGEPYEQIAMLLKMEEGISSTEFAAASMRIAEINGSLPMYKQVKRVLVSDAPMPLANGIKVQRQKLKKLVENGSWKCRPMDAALEQMSEDVGAGAEGEIANPRFLQIKQEVRKIFSDVLILPEEEIGERAHFVIDLGGDSLSVIGVIAQLEEKYNIEISDEDFARAVNVYEIAELIYKNTALSGEGEGSEAVRRITSFADMPEARNFEEHKAQYQMQGAQFVDLEKAANGKPVVSFANADYLGVSKNSDVVRAARKAVKRYGVGKGGGRRQTGECEIYGKVERQIAQRKHVDAALLLADAFGADGAVIRHLFGEKDLVLCDEAASAALRCGCQSAKAELQFYPHGDMPALEALLRAAQGKYEKVLIAAEGVCLQYGDLCPLEELVRLKGKYRCWLLLDGSHSDGVLGASGGGIEELLGIPGPAIEIRTGSLCGAFGANGGYIAGSAELLAYLAYTLPEFDACAPDFASVGAVEKILELSASDQSTVEKLQENIAFFQSAAQKRGIELQGNAKSAVFPIAIGSTERAERVCKKLLQKGYYAPIASWPEMEQGQAQLRFFISALHTQEQMGGALEALKEALQEAQQL